MPTDESLALRNGSTAHERFVLNGAGTSDSDVHADQRATARESWLASTNELLLTLLGSPPSSNPLTVIADHVAAAAGANRAVTLVCNEASGGPSDDSSPTLQRVDESMIATETNGGPRSAERWEGGLAEATGFAGRPALLIPLMSSDGCFGVVVAVRDKGATGFSDDDVHMAAVFGSTVSRAIEYLCDQSVRERMAIYNDRNRIAGNLHDIVIQRLFGVGLRLQALAMRIQPEDAASEVDSFVDQVDETIKDIRQSIFALHRPIDDRIGLRSKILNVVTAMPFSFEPRVNFEGPIDSAIPDRLHEDILVTLGELLTNILRHAHAHAVDVIGTVDLAEQRLVLSVRDDGIGWSGPPVAGRGTGNLSDRAHRLGGSCSFENGSEGGTLSRWSISWRDDTHRITDQ